MIAQPPPGTPGNHSDTVIVVIEIAVFAFVQWWLARLPSPREAKRARHRNQ
jgi:hypothetical protein